MHLHARYRPWGSLTWWRHDDGVKWKHFPRSWPFVRRIHRSPVNSPHKGQWRGVLMLSLICAWINASVNNREADYLRRHRTHYDITVMIRSIPNISIKEVQKLEAGPGLVKRVLSKTKYEAPSVIYFLSGNCDSLWYNNDYSMPRVCI